MTWRSWKSRREDGGCASAVDPVRLWPRSRARSGSSSRRQPSAKGSATANVAPEMAGLVPIESPMVGTFYRAPAPGADPYVKEGDFIQKGSVVCIIEAMKLMNEIETEVAGRVMKVMVENGQPVEFGQALFLVEPA